MTIVKPPWRALSYCRVATLSGQRYWTIGALMVSGPTPDDDAGRRDRLARRGAPAHPGPQRLSARKIESVREGDDEGRLL